MQALRFMGLVPSEELVGRFDQLGVPLNATIKRLDLAKRITTCAMVIILIASAILAGLACNQIVHPIVGVSLFLVALALGAAPCCLHRYQSSKLPAGTDLDEVYHPPAPPAAALP
ncbi:MAG: hypothetical protein JSS62_07255 [Verrucomicrobia bacterium]|nr:hypothetical protein [Verrucomicrobiota bacterium]MBS0645274.1 hypothetical protein [Verrucomicrobiota bacterium]